MTYWGRNADLLSERQASTQRGILTRLNLTCTEIFSSEVPWCLQNTFQWLKKREWAQNEQLVYPGEKDQVYIAVFSWNLYRFEVFQIKRWRRKEGGKAGRKGGKVGGNFNRVQFIIYCLLPINDLFIKISKTWYLSKWHSLKRVNVLTFTAMLLYL